MKWLFAFLLVLVAGAAQAQAPQLSPRHYLSAATNNSTSVTTSRTSLGWVVVGNTTATVYYLKLYSKATAPTCGTDTPLSTLPLPANQTVPLAISSTLFPAGLGFCITAGLADNDNTSAVTGIVVNLGISLGPH